MKKIITCIDGSAITEDVCHAGVWSANTLASTLLLLHAIEKRSTLPPEEDYSGAIGLGARSSLLREMTELDEKRSKIALTLGEQMLEHAEQLVTKHGSTRIEKMQRHSSIVEAIVDLEEQAQLVVLGRAGQGHAQNFTAVGSHIEQIIRQVHTPVLIANQGFTAPKSFMLAYDGREGADKAVERVLETGLLQGLKCHLVTVNTHNSTLKDKFQRTQARLQEQGYSVISTWLEGDVFDSLMEYKKTQPVDMLVMGAFSHSKFAQIFLGSQTLKMIEYTQLPLLVLR